jgi:CRP-like cAMP-binding protein
MMHSRPNRADTPRYRDFAVFCAARHSPLAPHEEALLRSAAGEADVHPPGADLVREGEPLNRPRLLLDGWAARQRCLSDGRRQIFGFVLPGDVFGISPRRHALAPSGIVCLTGAVVAGVPLLAEAMREESQRPLSQFVWGAISSQEICALDQIVRLGRQTAYERMLHLLLEFYSRLKQVGLVSGTAFSMPLTQEVVADALGLSVVHTNRTLQQLRRERLIETRGSVINLPDLPLLCEIADFRPPLARTTEQLVS